MVAMIRSMLAMQTAFATQSPSEAETELKKMVADARARGASQDDIILALAKVQADILKEHREPPAAPESRGGFSSLFGSKSSSAANAASTAAAPEPAKKVDAKAAAGKPKDQPPAAAAAAPTTAAAAGPAPGGDPKQGAAIFKAKCATCHTCIEGGPQKQGPNLFGVVGRTAGAKAGFTFTKALKEKNIEWTNENLLSFLQAPKGFAKGTSMAFPGFKKECDRADVVAYLQTLK